MPENFNKEKIDKWSVYNAFAMAIACIFALWFNQILILVAVFSLSLFGLIYINRIELFQKKPFFGVANSITFLRFLLVISSFLLFDLKDPFLLIYPLGASVVLDFFDGLAARYFKESSFFGQYFDMENDAFFVLCLCFYFYFFTDISWWILIPGILRYAFRIYTFSFPKPHYKEQKKTYATWIAAGYFIVLLIGLVSLGQFQFFVLLLGSLVLMSSFVIGFLEYQKA